MGSQRKQWTHHGKEEQRGTKETECKWNGNPKETMETTWEGKAMKEQRGTKEEECKYNGNPKETTDTPWEGKAMKEQRDLNWISPQIEPEGTPLRPPSKTN